MNHKLRNQKDFRVFRRKILCLIGISLIAFYPAPPLAGKSTSSKSATVTPDAVVSDKLLQPSDFTYLGAFRLPEAPEGGPDAATWEYGGQALTYRSNGDPKGPEDGFPGSLFASGHDTQNLIAEISIPLPVMSKDPEKLNTAKMLQPFHDVRGGLFEMFTEIPRMGMAYLDLPQTGAKIHLAWGQHFQEDEAMIIPSHSWCSPILSKPNTQGAWWIGKQSLYSVNGYLFEIPKPWGDAQVGGRYLVTGRFRDGGWSGRGPSLFAYAPWLSGNPPAPGTRLKEIPLLLYANTLDHPEQGASQLAGYQHPDEWTGGAWITTPGQKTAVIFAGTKGVGKYYWYGWLHTGDPNTPCPDLNVEGMTLVFKADGTPLPNSSFSKCSKHTSERGWWSSKMNSRIIFYDPADFAKVAAGDLKPDQPQPYAYLDIDKNLLLPDPTVEPDGVGVGAPRRYRTGGVAFDREHGLLYIVERFGDGAKPVIHVWEVKEK